MLSQNCSDHALGCKCLLFGVSAMDFMSSMAPERGDGTIAGGTGIPVRLNVHADLDKESCGVSLQLN